jgi:alpha-mannosidase
MIGHAHLDPVWLWPWQEGYQEARATFWSAIHRMDEYPDFVFICDQVVLLSWVEESDPELFERIREREREGRWVNVGGWWVEPDCNMPMGESFARQGLYGQRYLRSRFGRHATVGMNADPFGHNAMLPQILRGHRLDSYVFLRPGPHESSFASTLFWWEAPNGSRVLAYRIPFEYGSAGGDVVYQADKSVAALHDIDGDAMVFYGVGNHGGGPTKANIDSIHRYDRMGAYGRMRMSSPRRFFDEVLARGQDRLDALPVYRDDLQHHAPGCYSAHSGIKAWQRRAQYSVLSAERWAAVTAITDDLRYPRDDLDRAWKQILFNQFHDVLPGSAIPSAYDDARDQLGEATAIAKRIIARAHNVLARQIDVPFEDGSLPVVVFNPHPWALSTDVTIEFGGMPLGAHVVDADDVGTLFQRTRSSSTSDDPSRGAIVFRADLPALGYRLYRIRRGPAPMPSVSSSETGAARPESTLTVSEHVLENDLVRIEIDRETGWISSYRLKAAGTSGATDLDVMHGVDGARHTQICADPTDTWGHRVVSYAWPGESMRLERIVVCERGPLRSRVRIERTWGSSRLVEELVLDHDATAVRVDVDLDWREPAHLLKLRFPTALTDPAATYEIPYGTLERPVDGAEEPAQSWVDVTGTIDGVPAGLTVVTTNKHGYDVSPGDQPSIGITAVRSPVFAWHDPERLVEHGVYRFQDQGSQSFSYELVPHRGDWRAASPTRRASLLGSPVRAMLESSHPGALPPVCSFASDEGSVMITAVKGSQDPVDGGRTGGADLIVRAVETAGRSASVTLRLPVVDRDLEVEFGPSQIRTFRVPRDPAAPVVEVDLVEWPVEADVEPAPEAPTEPPAEPDA